VIIGCTNAGKSSLVAAQTDADPEVSEVPFTTWTPTPGMMAIENIQKSVREITRAAETG